MTPEAAPVPLRSPGVARASEPARRAGSLARRRGALLKLARRHGEVRLRVGDGRSAPEGSAEVSGLLDELNEGGLLRYGGLRRVGDACELIYLIA